MGLGKEKKVWGGCCRQRKLRHERNGRTSRIPKKGHQVTKAQRHREGEGKAMTGLPLGGESKQ